MGVYKRRDRSGVSHFYIRFTDERGVKRSIKVGPVRRDAEEVPGVHQISPSERAERDIVAADEAAVILGISTSSLHRWSRMGRLPSIILREGHSRNVRRWSRRALEAFLAQNAVGNTLRASARQAPGRRA